MEAIRLITQVIDNQVNIEVPYHLNNREVEVILLPIETVPSVVPKLDKSAFLQFLKNGPTFSDQELEHIEDVKKEFRHWTLDAF
ncbi:hypothetical protein U14_04580 [Candidatus Moduliflexus flocculans]|uniref:Uncharacterized protein n=1 Tax=Candidatus Moduliflexus flocculans TaxID=1499966 RepID=A0A0S6W5C1_9BACT|nr:hypothetical protein U14_04580 [Candidatus Moduliflexus flocculans]